MKTFPQRLDDFRESVVRIRQTSGLLWVAAPLWTSAWAVLLLVQGVIPAALVALTKWLVDALSAAIGSGRTADTLALVALPAGLMGGLLLLQRVLGGLVEWVSTAQSEYVDDYVTGLIHEQASAVDFAFYEAPEYHDLLDQVTSQGSSRVLQMLQNGGALVRTSVTLLSIGALLFVYGAWIPLALVVSSVPALLVVLRYSRIQHAWWLTATPRRRVAQYYGVLLTTQPAAAEVRMNRLSVPLIGRYRALRETLRAERLGLVRQQIVGRLGAAVASLVATAAVMGWVVWESFAGKATLGDLAAFYQAFTQAQSVIGTVLQSAGALFSNSLFLRHLFEFLALGQTVEDPSAPVAYPKSLRKGVRFEDVSFTYPGASSPALEGFSLDVPAGTTVAIVGENGAGKSTFIKLLCRFYDPTDGRITVDGTDLRAFRQEDVRACTSVLFQFPMRYQMTAAENVRLGTDADDASGHRLRDAVDEAGASALFGRLPLAEQTLLGRWFEGGVELSGGEWQRVALARAFYRDAPLVLLDEPTSSMDSWAENEWLGRFERVSAGRTTLVITHRFTTAMRADMIHVMERGRIVESGTHDALVALGGRYATSWAVQIRQSGWEEDAAAAGESTVDSRAAR